MFFFGRFQWDLRIYEKSDFNSTDIIYHINISIIPSKAAGYRRPPGARARCRFWPEAYEDSGCVFEGEAGVERRRCRVSFRVGWWDEWQCRGRGR